jgi:hypothetical protein
MKSGIGSSIEQIGCWKNPFTGQEEPYLSHLQLSHRRIIEGNYKIIYRVEKDLIYVTDVFDTRQDPAKMEGRVK